MITKFNTYLITESPDNLQTKSGAHTVSDNDAIAFFSEVNNDHNKVIAIYTGKFGESHSKVGYAEGRFYPGRMWINDKLISFWVYPNPTLFKSMIYALEKKLDMKIFNNGWKVEVIKKNGIIKTKEIKSTNKQNDYFFPDQFWHNQEDGYLVLIPVEKYIGSENFNDAIKKWHTSTWQEKEKLKQSDLAPSFKGFGSDLTAWDSKNPIWWRQLKYQENKKN